MKDLKISRNKLVKWLKGESKKAKKMLREAARDKDYASCIELKEEIWLYGFIVTVLKKWKEDK